MTARQSRFESEWQFELRHSVTKRGRDRGAGGVLRMRVEAEKARHKREGEKGSVSVYVRVDRRCCIPRTRHGSGDGQQCSHGHSHTALNGHRISSVGS